MTVHLPDELRERLATEAARQGKTVDALVAEIVAAQLPAETSENALDAFIGCGSSGRTEPFDVRQARRDLADKKLAEGA